MPVDLPWGIPPGVHAHTTMLSSGRLSLVLQSLHPMPSHLLFSEYVQLALHWLDQVPTRLLSPGCVVLHWLDPPFVPRLPELRERKWSSSGVKEDQPYRGMGKEDLLRHSGKPFWRRLRYICMSLVMIGWLALIITVVALSLIHI